MWAARRRDCSSDPSVRRTRWGARAWAAPAAAGVTRPDLLVARKPKVEAVARGLPASGAAFLIPTIVQPQANC